MNTLEIKLIDGSIINIAEEYIWIDEIEKNMNNQLDYIRIYDFIFNKQEIAYIKLIKEDKKND